jgi:hypothetical protein
MKASKWMLITAGALGLALLWYAQQDGDDTQLPTSSAASTAVAVVPTPINVDSPAAQLSAPASITQPVKKIEAPKTVDDYVDWQRELIEGLIVANDADSLLAAALILHALSEADPAERAKIRKLLDQAYSAAPGDRAIASVALRVCRAMEGCSSMPYENVVRTIDSRNALGPLREMLLNIERGTPKQKVEALEALASFRLGLYNAELVTRVAGAIARTPTSPRFAPDMADLPRLQSELALRAVGAVEVPSYLVLSSTCSSNEWDYLFACDAIVRDLSRSELIELQRLGLRIDAVRAKSRARKPLDITEAEAYLDWISSAKANTPPTAEQWIAMLGQYRTELAASRAWLERNGVAPRRVPSWLDRQR